MKKKKLHWLKYWPKTLIHKTVLNRSCVWLKTFHELINFLISSALAIKFEYLIFVIEPQFSIVKKFKPKNKKYQVLLFNSSMRKMNAEFIFF